MEQQGGRRIDVEDTVLEPGEIVIVPRSNSNVFPISLNAMQVANAKFPAARWIATLSKRLGAGFYSGVWGPLPFAVGEVEPEAYDVHSVRTRLRLDIKEKDAERQVPRGPPGR
jgi:hypothetical protein